MCRHTCILEDQEQQPVNRGGKHISRTIEKQIHYKLKSSTAKVYPLIIPSTLNNGIINCIHGLKKCRDLPAQVTRACQPCLSEMRKEINLHHST